MAFQHQESKDPCHNKPSASLLIKLTACASIAASVFAHSPGYGQMMKKTNNEFIQNKDNVEWVGTKDSLDHQKIIHINNDSLDINTIRNEFLIELNIERIKKGVKPLILNDTLNKTAQEYAEYMKNNNRYNHYDKKGISPEKRVIMSGYKKNYLGENIHKGPRTIFYFMQDQWESTPHAENALNPNAQDVGIGYIDGYRVIDFGGIFIKKIIYTF